MRIILKVLGGSRAYGTHNEESDIDIKGVCIASKLNYLGFQKRFEQEEKQVFKGDEHDEVIYDIQKFFKLACDCNPNILDILFCDDSDVLIADEIGQDLRTVRNLFLSKKAKHTFAGYAVSQLHRIIKKEKPAGKNSSRYHLWEKYGYDTKYAYHLVRLLRMGEEILRDGTVIVKRPDAEELISIRNGAWTLDQLQKYANDQLEVIDKLYQTSSLRYSPDLETLNELCAKFIERSFMEDI